MKVMNRKALETFLSITHAVPQSEYTDNGRNNVNHVIKDLLNHGIVLVDANGVVFDGVISRDLYNALNDLFGTDQSIWNQTFHKSWEKVATAPIEQLVLEQLAHYFSTYGMESLGYSATPVYPVEKILTDPATVPNIRAFTVIRVVDNNFAREMFLNYTGKTLAPHKNHIEGIIELLKVYGDPTSLYGRRIPLEFIASFELKAAYCDYLHVVPSNPQEFLRYAVYKATGSTLLVKDKRTIEAIKYSVQGDSTFGPMFRRADHTALASIFYRFKPLFLAFRANPDVRRSINNIRRLAPKYHVPQSDLNVQNLAKMASEGRTDDVGHVLNRCTGRQLIKVFNFCLAESARIVRGGQAVYNIRNGRLYVGGNDYSDCDNAEKMARYKTLVNLANQVSEALTAHYDGKLAGKKFYLPSYVNYAAPVSEKQFVGNIPYGSFIDLPGRPITMGIAWNNYKGRTDLDLHMTSPTRSFGWNSGYRDTDILYSGDMTDATNGAAEVYRFDPTLSDEEEVFILTVNNFTGHEGVPYKFLITDETFSRDRARGTSPISVDGAMFPPIQMKFDDRNAQSLGLVYKTGFYFYGGELGDSIVPGRDRYRDFLKAMTNRVVNMVQMHALIQNAGGELVTKEEFDAMTIEEQKEVIDLSPEALTARSLLDIVDCAD